MPIAAPTSSPLDLAPHVALIEDDPVMGQSVADWLAVEGYRTSWFRTGGEAVRALVRQAPDAVICDIRLPDMSGEEVQRALALPCGQAPMLFVTGHGDIAQAVRLMQAGAADYLTKPFDIEALLRRLEALLAPRWQRNDGAALGEAPAIAAVERVLRRVAPIDSTVLLTGPSGSGKEVAARLMHAEGPRARLPFVATNCAALPADLLESELFGHERGAFTGAAARHEGLAERAGAGTLFLDEVAELPAPLQAKLLRLLQERAFRRVGGERDLPFRARIVAATNADLDARVAEGRFREDLFFRLAVIRVAMPPLRARREDVLPLARRFLGEFAGSFGRGLRGFTTLAEDALMAHDFPGNVRELRNRVERAAALGEGELVTAADLFPEHAAASRSGAAVPTLADARDAAERRARRNGCGSRARRCSRSCGGWACAATAADAVRRTGRVGTSSPENRTVETARHIKISRLRQSALRRSMASPLLHSPQAKPDGRPQEGEDSMSESKREIRQRADADALATEVLRHGTNTQRRSLFVSAAAFGAAAMTIPGVTPASAQTAPAAAAAPARRPIIKDDSRVLNIGATVRSGNYWNFKTFMTPVEEFYVRNHYPTPTVETRPVLARENWKLRIHGASVERPIELSYNDLLGMRSRTIIATMECHGNGRTLFWEQDGLTGQQVAGGNWVLGAVGQAEWQYVPMSEIFARVGIKPDARTVLFWSGVDGNDMGRPMPYSDVVALQHDMGVCFAMNGNPLVPDHGAPVRMVVPGWGGTASIKWLTEIRVTDKRVWCRLNTRGEVFIGPTYQRPEFSATEDEFIGVGPDDIQGPMVTWMPPKSFITVPLVLEKSPAVPANYPLQRGQVPRLAAGRQELTGYAWAPQHGVRQVEVRINGGGWQRAEIRQPNLGKYTWVRFSLPWDAAAGQHVIETRTTDNAGTAQPESVPMNTLGMANWGIPKFRVEVA